MSVGFVSMCVCAGGGNDNLRASFVLWDRGNSVYFFWLQTNKI